MPSCHDLTFTTSKKGHPALSPLNPRPDSRLLTLALTLTLALALALHSPGYPTLSRRHQVVLAKLLQIKPRLIVSGRPDAHAEGLGAYVLYLRHFLSKKPPPTMEERLESPDPDPDPNPNPDPEPSPYPYPYP